MEVQPDFKEWLGLLNSHQVEYVVVGAFALAHLGAPRFTGDLDVLVKPHPENARRVLSALKEFGFGSVGLTEDDFSKPDRIVQLGYPPVRIDLITSISAVSWDEAFSGKSEGWFGDVPVSYLGRRQFLMNKRAVGRQKDLADLEALGG